ncbi:hypothetical protein, partial [Desulfolutivibrio sp.]|uniref:hypothetical protein n=1 Tax=Desulfolutivibrio sp. TaxID=2773296 RepID=UPI002F962F51
NYRVALLNSKNAWRILGHPFEKGGSLPNPPSPKTFGKYPLARRFSVPSSALFKERLSLSRMDRQSLRFQGPEKIV